jgi:hypothetical protein
MDEYDTDKGKLKYSEKCLSQCYFVNHKSHIDWLGINPLKTKHILSDTKPEGVPRSKHSPPQFKKPII